MKTPNKIEAEGGELILRNSAGDIIIVPKKYRQEVQDMVKDGCFGCIDNLASTLPVMDEYAEDGTLVKPDWPPTKNKLRIPQPLPQTYEDVVNPLTDPEKLKSNTEKKKDQNSPNIHVLVESPKRKWFDSENAQNNLPEYKDFLAKKMLGKPLDEYEAGLDNKIDEKLTNYYDAINNVDNYNEYLKTKGLNPVSEEYIDDFFNRSAERLQQNLPNVTITQTYGNPQQIDSVFKSVQPNDRIVIMGHNGSKLLGIDNRNIATSINEMVADKTGVECLLGSCNSADLIDQYEGSGIPVSGYKGVSWYVPYDKGNDLHEMMFGWDYEFSADGKRSVVKSPLDKKMTRMYDK